ncbi:MAG TPA: MotA/TolQ/ExbB proton channel family protein [Gammaproteobacteria bacterium]|nr:MotA/TolQ/ExbB proton channel family protein [Gammaproteobacteria bacterium]HPI95997.1 MotA/TolQ/ExbB proton channel family protein [Gammaproteobacteria bacterium]HPQ87508.1 MotA/TolQ/ExbB proton channel family protein [Gammaproteobacteria bacterium]
MKHKPLLFILLLLLNIETVFSQTENTEQTEIPPVDNQKVEQDIQNAYKKEYAFLTTQVKNLQTRISEYKSQAQKEEADINREISRLENLLLSLEQQSNQLEDDIFSMQRNSESATNNNELINATITQAQSTLTEYNLKLPEAFENQTEIEKITDLVDFAKGILSNSSKTSKHQGNFFLQDGTEVQGQILKVGNIASYGISPKGSGVLAPAGENNFKIWNSKDNDSVKNILNSNTVDSLPIFLYESSVKPIEEKQSKTIKGVVDSGGIIAWIIFVLGVIAALLIIMRFWFLKKASSSTEKILNKIVNHIENEDMSAAIKVAKSKKSSSSRVLYAVLRNITRDREHIEDIVSESILHESGQLNRFGSLIMVIATVSPLLGLLGTVTGMISTFDIITEFGTGDPKLLSSGISIALITTEIGLAVAIPALLFGNVLSGWAERIKDDMEKASLRVINVYKKIIG